MSRNETSLARECLYRFFSLAITEPDDLDWCGLLDPASQEIAKASGDALDVEHDDAIGPAVAAVLVALRQPMDELRLEYQRVFGLTPARECPPFETEYHGNAEPFYCSQQLADIAGFYRAFGLNPGPMATVRPDHLALEFEFMAFLLMKQRLLEGHNTEALEVCAKAERDFFCEHIAWWTPAFAAGLIKRAGSGIYEALGRAIRALIVSECRRFGVTPIRTPLAVVAAEEREEPSECAGCAAN